MEQCYLDVFEKIRPYLGSSFTRQEDSNPELDHLEDFARGINEAIRSANRESRGKFNIKMTVHAVGVNNHHGDALFVFWPKGGPRSGGIVSFGVSALSYGSCSGCDAILNATSLSSNEKDLQKLSNIALHLFQNATTIQWTESFWESLIRSQC